MLKLLKNVNALANPEVCLITRASRAPGGIQLREFSVLPQMLKNFALVE
jgi:hypothetical protein